MTFSLGGTCSATAALVSPILGRRSNRSTSPSRSPRTSTVPCEGNMAAAATWSKEVLPAPLGPIRIQRSSSCAVQSTLRSRTAASRRTSTPRSRSTSSDIRAPFRAALGGLRRLVVPSVVPSRPNLRHRTPAGLAERDLSGPGFVPVFVADREQRGLGTVLHAELGQHRAHVSLDGL